LKMLREKSPTEAVEIMRKTIEEWILVTDDALSSTEAAVDVLNDLLNYDKIESGTLRLELSSVPIWQVLKKTTAGFAMQAKEKNVTFTLSGKLWDGQLSPSDLTEYQALRVVGDSMRISQVLRNIMSNAIKFTPTDSTVSIHAEWLPEALTDAHIDIPPEESEQWFRYIYTHTHTYIHTHIHTLTHTHTYIHTYINTYIHTHIHTYSHPRAGAIQMSVTDTGAGLSAEQLLEIGAEGVQFNANNLQQGQGSGLGLFISKGTW
jgi:signal transduction histidine kinase